MFHSRGVGARLKAMLLVCLLWLPAVVHAQISQPNGEFSESVIDLRVKVLGGHVAVERQYLAGRWQVGASWNALKFAQDSLDGSVKSIERNGTVFERLGDAWVYGKRMVIRRATVPVLPVAPESSPATGIPGQGGQALTNAAGYRWTNRTGEWIDYDAEGRISAYGDRNNVTVWFQHDAQGRLKYVLDHFGRVVLSYTWTGTQLTRITDNPALIAGNSAPARSVAYAYSGTTSGSPAYPLLAKVTDVRGYDTTYTYEAGKLKTLTDPEKRTRTLTYGPTGRIASFKDADGAETSWVYDYDKTKREFYVRTSGPLTAAGRRVEETWYDADGRVIRRDVNGKTQASLAQDSAARTQTRTDARGNRTVTQTDEFDNPVKVAYPDGSTTSARYSPVHGQVLEEVDELGVKTSYEYDARGNLTKKTEAAGLPEARITEYIVDGHGQLLSRTRKGGSLTLPTGASISVPDATTAYGYDEQGNVAEVTDPQGGVARYRYDLSGKLTHLTDARGYAWQAAYDAGGNLLSRSDPLGNVSRNSYNKAGERIEAKNALGHASTYAYDGKGRLTQATDPLGHARSQAYDPYGRMTAQVDEAGNRIQELAYDLDGRLVETQDGNGNATRYVFGEAAADSLPNEIRFPTFSRSFTYDARLRTTQTRDKLDEATSHATGQKYDARGNVTEVLDRNGQATRMAYDALGRLVEVIDPAGGKTQYTYDGADNLRAVTDPNGNSTLYGYDKAGRRVSETRPLGEAQRYAYDAAGNLTEFEDAKGNRIQYVYDEAARRVQEKHLAAGASSAIRTIDYRYNAAGALTGYSDANGAPGAVSLSASYTLDALNRKTAETLAYGGTHFTLATTYGATGRKSGFTWPDGLSASYSYDANQNLQAIVLPTGSISVGETKWNAPAKITYPGGSTRTQSYDAFMRLAGIKLTDPGQGSLMDYRYTYDAQSNITRKDTEHGSYSYGYDALYRLTQAANASPLPQEAFSYDKLGNRLTDATRPGTWQYNGNNQLLRSYTEAGQPIDYSYDENGSLVSKQSTSADPKDSQQFQYDAANRLAQVLDRDGNTVATYQYDPFGRRVRKTLYRDEANSALGAPRTLYYIYGDEGLVAEATGSGTITAQYGWRPQGTWGTDPVFLKAARQGQSTQELFYYQNDHLGTPQRLIGQDGTTAWQAKASAFGVAQVEPASSVANNLRLPGQYLDGETGTHYNYFRTYAPTRGQFLEEDPAGSIGGNNWYLYAAANPLTLADPFGLLCQFVRTETRPGWADLWDEDHTTEETFRAWIIEYELKGKRPDKDPRKPGKFPMGGVPLKFKMKICGYNEYLLRFGYIDHYQQEYIEERDCYRCMPPNFCGAGDTDLTCTDWQRKKNGDPKRFREWVYDWRFVQRVIYPACQESKGDPYGLP